ncbi:MAG: hypothetical protein PGN24_03685 [Microbacterium arborescens]
MADESISVWGMSDVVDLLTDIRDSLAKIESHLDVISDDTGDDNGSVLAAVRSVRDEMKSGFEDLVSSMPT